MSVGHVARSLETAGIATVIIAAAPFAGRLIGMHVPRLLATPFPMGRPLGRPHEAATQQAIVRAALCLFEAADRADAIAFWQPTS